MSKNITITMNVSKVTELSVHMCADETVKANVNYVPSDILTAVPQYNPELDIVTQRVVIEQRDILISVPSEWFFAHAIPLLKRPNRATAYLTRTQTAYAYTYQYFDVATGTLKDGSKVVGKRLSTDPAKALKALTTSTEIAVKVLEVKELTHLYGMEYQTLLDHYLSKGGEF